MDDQRQIQAGAGLQESRLNEDFINFLKKWGPFATYGVLALVLVWLGFGQYNSWQERQTDQAFADLTAADGVGTLEAYKEVWETWDDREAVGTLARIRAAQLLQNSAIVGLEVGADVIGYEDGQVLTAEERTRTWQASLELATAVKGTETSRGRTMFAQRARWMIADAQISLGNFDAARAELNEFIQVATREHGEDGPTVLQAQARLSGLDALSEPVELAIESRAILPSAPDSPGLLPLGVDINETAITTDILREASEQFLEDQNNAGGTGDGGGAERHARAAAHDVEGLDGPAVDRKQVLVGSRAKERVVDP